MSLTVTLIRGLPGSGKSTLAQKIEGIHLEADMYFVDDDGQYHFDPNKLNDAHRWCQNQSEYWLKQGKSIVVSNTFVRRWEMDAYRKLAKRYKAKLVVKVCRGQFGNVHNVPEETLAQMQKRWQE
ncbi:ATP-binding protein [Vibrio nitrifigilis]|uniref:ATP-binding protein n=1 Tax=Vibrio nitrifigilis TaxID=2789781 RepID=A0ABS0GCQ8_9VIBR|nr:ATP-binding protein [Vibrio nitrifigilis]MBF9000189.1 ATP-binding protein [Vibrio nitrifigilis]